MMKQQIMSLLAEDEKLKDYLSMAFCRVVELCINAEPTTSNMTPEEIEIAKTRWENCID
jgi:hypothetical protein